MQAYLVGQRVPGVLNTADVISLFCRQFGVVDTEVFKRSYLFWIKRIFPILPMTTLVLGYLEQHLFIIALLNIIPNGFDHPFNLKTIYIFNIRAMSDTIFATPHRSETETGFVKMLLFHL
jgi:hypothetical protein